MKIKALKAAFLELRVKILAKELEDKALMIVKNGSPYIVIAKEEMVYVVHYPFLEEVQRPVAHCVAQPLHHRGLSSTGVTMLRWHALVDLNSHLLLCLVVQAPDYLTESPLIELFQDLIAKGNMVANYELVEPAVTIEAVISIPCVAHAVASRVENRLKVPLLFGLSCAQIVNL